MQNTAIFINEIIPAEAHFTFVTVSFFSATTFIRFMIICNRHCISTTQNASRKKEMAILDLH